MGDVYIAPDVARDSRRGVHLERAAFGAARCAGGAGIETLSIERPGLHDAFVAIAGEAAAERIHAACRLGRVGAPEVAAGVGACAKTKPAPVKARVDGSVSKGLVYLRKAQEKDGSWRLVVAHHVRDDTTAAAQAGEKGQCGQQEERHRDAMHFCYTSGSTPFLITPSQGFVSIP